MFEQGRTQDAACPHQECAGRKQDREHLFCSCSLVSSAWVWLRTRLMRYFPTTIGAGGISSEDFLLLCFPKDLMDKELVWLIGNYCDIVVKQVLRKKGKLTADRVSAIIKARPEEQFSLKYSISKCAILQFVTVLCSRRPKLRRPVNYGGGEFSQTQASIKFSKVQIHSTEWNV